MIQLKPPQKKQPQPEKKSRFDKDVLVGFILVGLIVISVLAWLFWPSSSPVPSTIKKEANFTIIWPANHKIDANSWQYLNAQSSVSFNTYEDGIRVVINEQQIPLAFQNDNAAYERFIGSLKPSANFNVPLGTASIADFVTSSNLIPIGKSGILNADGTLLVAHPDNNLSDDGWRDLFNSLKS